MDDDEIDVNSIDYSIFISDIDSSQHKLHTIKVSNELADSFSSSETQLFFLVANELHWINEANSLVKLGHLVDFRDDTNKTLNIVQIKVRSCGRCAKIVFKYSIFCALFGSGIKMEESSYFRG